MDDRVISKLLEVDPTFAAFVDRLEGVSKSMPGVSDVHVNGTGSQKKPMPADNNGKKALAGGLLFGTAAESASAGRAVGAARQAVRPTRVAAHAAPKVPGLLKHVAESPKGKVAEAGLQVANFGVGLLAAKELVKKPKKSGVSKGYMHALPRPLVASRARLRATTEAQPKFKPVTVSKARLFGGLQDAAKLNEGLHSGAHLRKVERMRVSGEVDDAKQAYAGRSTKGFARHASTPASPRHANAASSKRGLVAVGAATTAGAAAGAAGITRIKKAPQQPIAKSVSWEGEISKVDEDKRQVFGWASIAVVDGQPVLDLQDDHVTIEEIEKSAYQYVLDCRVGGDMHSRISKGGDAPLHTADVIESFVVTPEKLEAMGLAPDALPLGWWLGMKVNDDAQWQDVKNGKRGGFSVHGRGVRKELAA